MLRDSWLTGITRSAGSCNLVTQSTNFAQCKNFVCCEHSIVLPLLQTNKQTNLVLDLKMWENLESNLPV